MALFVWPFFAENIKQFNIFSSSSSSFFLLTDMAREQSRYRREIHHKQHISEKDPFSSSRSIIPSPVSTTNDIDHPSAAAAAKKKKNFPSGKFRGLGCKASSKVFVPCPCVIKTSANWKETKKFKKKNKGSSSPGIQSLSSSGLPDVWCSENEGNDADAAAAASSSSGDCLLPRRHVDGENTPHREIVIMQNRVAMARRLEDIYRDDWRLDIDHMSYEELLALTDRIGYVSTGLKEDEIQRCVTKLEPLIQEREKKCSICQEEYEANNEKGKLKCGHYFHMQCIKLWLKQKNSCPMCKTEVLLKR